MSVVGLGGNMRPACCVPHALVLRQRYQQPNCRHTGAAGPASGSVPGVLLPVWVISWALVDCIQEEH